MAEGKDTREDPWVLKTPPGSSEYTMYRDDTLDPPAVICNVGSTELRYQARAIDDLHRMLKARGMGSSSEAPTRTRRRKKVPWRPGLVPKTTPSAVCMG